MSNGVEMNPNLYRLQKSIDFEGDTIVSLDLDFDNLTAENILSAERQFNAENPGYSNLKEMSKAYLACIVANAAKQPVELIKKLSGKDFSHVTVRAQLFLLT